MKNKLFIIFSAILLVVIFSNADFVKADGCSQTIQILNQDPIPATPGSYVTLTFQASGLTGACMGNGFAVMLNPSYPFSLDPNVSSIQTLQSTPTDGQSWTFTYKLRVDQNAIDGTYPLEMRYHTGNSPDFSSAVVQDFNVSVSNVQTDFAVVIQSNSGSQVSLGIVNVGKNAANSLIVEIPTQNNSFRATGTSQQILGNLAAGDYTIASFTVVQVGTGARTANPGGGTGNFTGTIPAPQSLKVQLDYTDIIGVRRSVIKEVPFTSSGNSTIGNINGRFQRPTGISAWWFVGGGGIVVLIAGFILFKNRKRIKNHLAKRHEKHSNKAPDWVLEEKTHKK